MLAPVLVALAAQASVSVSPPASPPGPEAVGTEQVGAPSLSVEVTPLSPPTRVVETRPVEGRDVCAEDRRDAGLACTDPIEGRAADFAPSDPNPLSPEQRVIVGSRILAPAPVADRMVRGSLDADSPSDQALASAAARQRGDPVDRQEPLADLEKAIGAGVILPDGAVQPPVPQ